MYESESHPSPIIEPQEKVLIITRRLYNGDVRRHFVGTVERFQDGIMRVRGYAFVYELKSGGFVRRKNPRERLFAVDNHLVVFVLPEETEIRSVHYEMTEKTGLVVTDDQNFRLEINEFNA
jgi:hypothetical protein